MTNGAGAVSSEALQERRARFARIHRKRCTGALLVKRHLKIDGAEIYQYECAACKTWIKLRDVDNPMLAILSDVTARFPAEWGTDEV